MIGAMSAVELKEALRRGIQLVDVRTPAEFREVHVKGARNIPLDRLNPAEFDKDAQYFIICKSGGRSMMACQQLQHAGFENLVNIDGGTLACVDEGLPVRRGKEVISLERQVRIVAGSLVLLGITLGWFVHAGFFGLSAFVGAGLVFAGITDTCGMGMLLGRMPWNQ